MPLMRADIQQACLTIDPLPASRAGEAFVLARHWLSDLVPERWNAFIAAWEAGGTGRGLMEARNQRGALLGIAAWWRLPDLRHGETLWAEVIAIRELGVRPIVREALLSELQRMARAGGQVLRMAGNAARTPALLQPAAND